MCLITEAPKHKPIGSEVPKHIPIQARTDAVSVSYLFYKATCTAKKYSARLPRKSHVSHVERLQIVVAELHFQQSTAAAVVCSKAAPSATGEPKGKRK